MNSDINSNCSFYKDLEENFSVACKLAEQEFTHEELINMLSSGNIPQKEIAALKFDYVNNRQDANALLSNLTGCDGKIREAVALKINTILNQKSETKNIFAENSADVFADATIDINANICRLVVDSAFLLKEFKNFSNAYTDKILKFAVEALDELDKFIYKDKKYTINKQIFKLYWCLEALSIFYIFADDKLMENILVRCSKQGEYTIREKTAQIISASNKFPQIKEKLQNDENYYVKQALHHPGVF